MTKCFCDKCGKKLPKTFESILIPRRVTRYARDRAGDVKLAAITRIEAHDTDLCNDCLHLLLNFFPVLDEEDIND